MEIVKQMTSRALLVAAAAITAAIVAVAATGGFAAADGDHRHGDDVLQHLRDHAVREQAKIDAAQAALATIAAAQAVVSVQSDLATVLVTLAIAEQLFRTCSQNNNCIPTGNTGSQIDNLRIVRGIVSDHRDNLATARDTAAAAIDSDSDGFETYAAFTTSLRVAEARLSYYNGLAVLRYLQSLRVNLADIGRCRITLDAVPEGRRWHAWSSGTVCWDRNDDGDFDDAGEVGSLLLDE